ncbi:hypothetical protein M407DRAFT_30858 [Tulasnella calospora MUT 4182]|uniref:Uncharacterized protein n=1 Tax=Tulasnella calospora MUT 4182 TaxID=1051891 RepID=A0A0C3PWR4_9AGAM|nr:hypothetical protein M407DRAFT_30858 [Tulasnella calospora MUT 4182]
MAERYPSSFRGSSAAEAEDFVQAVRCKAWAEEKQFDYRWMAAYAAAQMSGQALRWHMGLPRDIQSDWGKLEVAILDRFAPNQPPAAPSNDPIVPNGASAQPPLRTGRIRITERDTGRFVGYVSKEWREEKSHGWSRCAIQMATQADDSPLVEFRPSSSPTTFDLVDKSKFYRLALRVLRGLELHASDPTIIDLISFTLGPKPGSIRYSSPVTMGSVAHVQHAVWKVDLYGSITLIWPSSPQVEIGASINKRPNGLLYLRSNMTSMMNNDYAPRLYTRVKLEFEDA